MPNLNLGKNEVLYVMNELYNKLVKDEALYARGYNIFVSMLYGKYSEYEEQLT